MKSKSLILLAVAAGFGLVAMLGVMQVINGKGGKEPTVRVLTAAVDIPSGMPLSEGNVVFKEMPQSAVPGGAVTKKEEYEGKAIISRAVAGEIIMIAKLGGAEAITASHQIPKGMRVATVSVDATKSHSGLIRPTDRVDVVCTYEAMNPMTRQKSTRVKTVLDYIEVFAVDSVRAGREGEVDGAVKNVSLLCTPEQVQLLTAVRDLGKLDLSLRNREDKDTTQVAELTDSIFQTKGTSEGSREEPTAAPAPAAEPVQTAKQGPGLQDFLASAMTAMSGMATVPASAQGTPTWTMTICRGDKLEDVEVLDEGALPSGMSAAERQRRRAESRLPADEREDSGAKNVAGPAEPGTDADAGPTEPASPAQPAESAPAEATGTAPQASLPGPATPALLPFTPFGG